MTREEASARLYRAGLSSLAVQDMVAALEALGLIKFETEVEQINNYVARMAPKWRQSPSGNSMGLAILDDLDLAGFKIVRKDSVETNNALGRTLGDLKLGDKK